MIPRFKPTLGYKELKAAVRRARKDDIVQFEKDFAKLMDQRFAVAFPYGRTGLIFLLKALGLKGKEVICPAYTCVVVPHAIVYSSNTPVFVDCAADGFNMDLDMVEQNISENTGAIIATSLFGYPVDLDKLDRIRTRYPHIWIIQDCAHSFGAKWKERPVQKEGVAALFGLNISKTITSIFGGMISTDNPKLFRRLKKIRDEDLAGAERKKGISRLVYLALVYAAFWGPVYRIVNRMERVGLLNGFVKYYDEKIIDMPRGYLKKMSSIEARVGRTNLERYNDVLKARRCAADYYFCNLKGAEEFALPPQISGATYSHFAVRVSDRKRWLDRGIKKGVQVGWLIEYCIPGLSSYRRFAKKDFPYSEEYAKKTINLPTWGGVRVAKEVVKRLF